MADQKLSEKNQTATVAGTFIHVIVPDGSGGWLSRRIAYNDFLSTVTSEITDLQRGIKNVKYPNQSADFNQAFTGLKLISVDYTQISGNPEVKLGTTAGGDDIHSLKVVNSGTDRNITLGKSFGSGSMTLYFTIAGGEISINLNYQDNIF